MKISTTISINKKCHSHQWFLASKCEWEVPKLQSSRCHSRHVPQIRWLVIASRVGVGGAGIQEAAICHSLRWTRNQDLAPGSWHTHERKEFSEPRGLHLPIYRMWNSLTWHLIFDVQTSWYLCCNLVYSLTTPPPTPPSSLEQFSQRYWDTVSGAWSPKHYHQIK